MRSTTIKEFGGGWNVIDSPAALSLKYASTLENFYRKADGSQAIRYGTQWFADISIGNLAEEYLGLLYEADAGTEAIGDAIANGKSVALRVRTPNVPDGEISGAALSVDAVTVAADFVASIYTDNAGSPGTIVGVASAPVNIATAGTKLFVLSVPVSPNTLYWLVFTDQGATGNVTVDTVANQGGDFASGKNDVITSIVDDGLGTSRDLKARLTYDRIVGGDIVDFKYFNASLISVTEDGEVTRTTNAGATTVIWTEALAREQAGNPTGWSTGLDFVSFTEIKGSLIICNGVDKPLEVQNSFSVRYLQDLATGSNVNTPIGKYCTTVSDYLCIAGVAAEPNVVYIGSKGTVGVFVGDPAPNDSVALNVGAFAPEEGDEIRGLSSFRNFLFVHFFTSTLKIILGEYDASGNHVPVVDDTLQKFGITSHRVAVPVVNDLLFGDVSGANTIKRNVLSGAVEPSQLSELIAPAYQEQIASVSQDDMLTDIFAVYDRLAGHYMIFVPTGVGNAVRTFVYTFQEKGGRKSWSEFIGWTWRAATSSSLGRVFFAKDTRIYQYGNEAYNEEYSADFVGEYDSFYLNSTSYAVGDRVKDPETDDVYVCLIANTSEAAGTFAQDRTANPSFWIEYEGENIHFDWEFPWTDANSRARIKRLGFLKFDTQGTSRFDVDVFVDNIYTDADGDLDPALTLNYAGGDSPGYGGGDQPYGGGRRTTDERLWSHPVKFMLAKLRIHGETKLPLRVVTVTLMFAEGKFGR